MRVNYFVLFILGAGLGYYYFFKFKNRQITLGGFRTEILPNLYSYICIPLICGILLDLIILAITPSVIIAKDNSEYEKPDYLFFYKDKSGETHILAPFGNYLDNQSSQILAEKIYAYGAWEPSEDLITFKKEYYIGFHNLGFGGDPDKVFAEPPARVKGRYTQRILHYKDFFLHYKDPLFHKQRIQNQ